jgi:hypothetical protein
MKKDKKILIIGGGFYGLYLADCFTQDGFEVQLIEKEDNFMKRASYVNQARIHNGYHYPRSVLTALRSRISFPRFVNEFKDCVDSDFEKYYLIGSPLGKITGLQFLKFCERIGAKCDSAPEKIRNLTNPSMVDSCFSVIEYAFDSTKLRDLMLKRLNASKLIYKLKTSVESVKQKDNGLEVELKNLDSGQIETVYSDHVFNCTYSRINYVNMNSKINLIPFKHEMTEMCIVDVPDILKKIGLTVMCGPFFSTMPFPSEAGHHSFSHVRYTPHFEWQENSELEYIDSLKRYEETNKNSAWLYMQKDASRFIPILKDCVYQKSIWEVKTILPRSEADDSRPILFLPNYGLKGFHCVMGGKIDNVYDVMDAIKMQNVIY